MSTAIVKKPTINFQLDGLEMNQISDNLTSYQPSVDGIQKFDMITNNAPRAVRRLSCSA